MGNRYRYGCPSGKRGFASEGTAYLQMLHVNERKAQHGEGRMIRSIYRCPECSRWHHTSWVEPFREN